MKKAKGKSEKAKGKGKSLLANYSAAGVYQSGILLKVEPVIEYRLCFEGSTLNQWFFAIRGCRCREGVENPPLSRNCDAQGYGSQ
jgi:hypothetical protein